MSRRNQPYLPLYVQDFLTDEKLIECSASATGIYSRLLCIMHKSEPYGTILLKQKDKQTENTCLNFALKISKQMPYKIEEIEAGLNELITERVITLNENKIYQKRMVRDNELSEKRSQAGKKGGKKTQKFAKAKVKANTEDEYIYNNNIDIKEEDKKEEILKKKEEEFKREVETFSGKYPDWLLKEFISYWTEPNKSRKKIKYELEKTWDTSRRLANWANRNKNFNKEPPKKEHSFNDGKPRTQAQMIEELAKKKTFK